MVQDSPDPALTIDFIKKERFKFNLKWTEPRVGAGSTSERSLVAEGSTSCSTLTEPQESDEEYEKMTLVKA